MKGWITDLSKKIRRFATLDLKLEYDPESHPQFKNSACIQYFQFVWRISFWPLFSLLSVLQVGQNSFLTLTNVFLLQTSEIQLVKFKHIEKDFESIFLLLEVPTTCVYPCCSNEFMRHIEGCERDETLKCDDTHMDIFVHADVKIEIVV